MNKLLSSRRFFATLLVIGLQSALLAAPQTSPAANQDNQPPRPVVLPPPPAGAAAAVDSNGYKVQSPDVLKVDIWHQPDLSCVCSVHPDGAITMPLIGDIQVGGKTPAAIEKIVKESLSKYVRDPIATVTVLQVLSKKYYMDGEVNRPGEYELISKTTVLEAISKAGGLAPFASERKIYVLRGDKRIMFNYKQVIHGKNLDQNIDLQPDDHVVVP